MFKLTVIVSILVLEFACGEMRYDNYSLYKITPKNEDQVKHLKELEVTNPSYDFWIRPNKANHFVNLLVTPDDKSVVDAFLRKFNIDFEIKVENIQKLIDEEKLHRRSRRDVSARNLYWTNYQTLDEIYEWFEYLVGSHPNVVSIVSGGQSHEGRELKGIKISRNSGNKAILLEGGMIGADWLSPTVLTYVINELVNNEDATIRQISFDYDFYIFPVTNPDGLEYSQNFVRLWTKNRRSVGGNNIGVDLTRNWNSHWGVVGASFDRSSNNYVSIGPFSELETRQFAQFVETISNDLLVFLSFRSFGQRFTIPFGNTTEHLSNYDNVYIIANRAMQSLSQRYGTVYQVGTPNEVHEAYSGSSMDWAKHRFNVPIVGTYHLRDEGNFGYTLPVAQVLPTCEETMDSIVTLITEGQAFGYL